ncbi:Thioredoxin domain [Melia azedarach]|uniref:Thioredoxin domain n=1 Tax=Melia azedarach TaxID=155640 RepID=A0ACC1XS81_MELAZ|nr:Thioredoxin domain [Melia azedarach]
MICIFYHNVFYRCKILDKHLKVLVPKHRDKKFIKLDEENAPFFFTNLEVKTLPCVIFFRHISYALFGSLENNQEIVYNKHSYSHNPSNNNRWVVANAYCLKVAVNITGHDKIESLAEFHAQVDYLFSQL